MKGGPYTTGEAAEILGINSHNVREYCAAGRILFHYHPGTGRHRRISAESLIDFLRTEGSLANPVYVNYMRETWQDYEFRPPISQQPQQS